MKTTILLLSFGTFLSCKNSKEKNYTFESKSKSQKEIQDSIRKKQEQDVVNMDTDLDSSTKALDKDLKKIK